MKSRARDSAGVPSEREDDFRRGMELLGELGEIMPDEVDEPVARIYEELRTTFRVPFVNFLFRVLANYPEPFAEAWAALRPTLGTVGFERAADHLRAAAVSEPTIPTADVDWSAMEGLARVRAFTASIHYVLPKLLLTAIALDRLLGREDEAAREAVEPIWLGMEAATALPAGSAAGTVRIPLLDPHDAQGRVHGVFEDIKKRHGHPGVASYYRALGHWPDLLATLWNEVSPGIGSASRTRQKDRVVSLAASLDAALHPALPRLSHPGVRSGELAALLSVFRYRLIPDLLLDVTHIRAVLDGQGAAYASPFSWTALNRGPTEEPGGGS